MFIDTHAHLFKEYYSDLDDVILECLNNGVNKIIVSGCDMASNKEVLELVMVHLDFIQLSLMILRMNILIG